MRIELDRASSRPGEKITVRASWPALAGRRWMELRLSWRTKGKGDEDVSFARRVRLQDPEHAGESEEEIELPDGPYSYSGKLISVVWRLELEGSERELVVHDLVLSPTGEEIRHRR